jgi:hypothetical protein
MIPAKIMAFLKRLPRLRIGGVSKKSSIQKPVRGKNENDPCRRRFPYYAEYRYEYL